MSRGVNNYSFTANNTSLMVNIAFKCVASLKALSVLYHKTMLRYVTITVTMYWLITWITHQINSKRTTSVWAVTIVSAIFNGARIFRIGSKVKQCSLRDTLITKWFVTISRTEDEIHCITSYNELKSIDRPASVNLVQ